MPSLFAEQAPAPDSTPFAIQHVNIINVENGTRVNDQTVVVSGGRIIKVGSSPKIKVPGKVRIVDGAGKFLIPGLWEMHFHAIHIFPERTLPYAVARGITDARDMGAPLPLSGSRKERN